MSYATEPSRHARAPAAVTEHIRTEGNLDA